LEKGVSHGKAKYHPFIAKGDFEKRENAGGQEGGFSK
jgi:hypothetical protein